MSSIDSLTTERGKNYGHPRDHFDATQRMYQTWARKRDKVVKGQEMTVEENALRHAVYMIIDKLVRSADNAHHEDNWDDIQGYIKCLYMARGEKSGGEEKEAAYDPTPLIDTVVENMDLYDYHEKVTIMRGLSGDWTVNLPRIDHAMTLREWLRQMVDERNSREALWRA